MREIEISQREAGQRLDRFLAKYMPQASTGFLHKMLRKKNIKRNRARAAGSDKLEAGDRIQLFLSEETLDKFCGPGLGSEIEKERDKGSGAGRKSKGYPGVGNEAGGSPGGRAEDKGRPASRLASERSQVKLLYQDQDILAFHKPAGLLTQKAGPDDDSLNDYLIDYCLKEGILSLEDLRTFHPSVANRLDRNTSGIVLCGISIRGLQTLSGLLKSRDLGKYYLCPVEGEMKGEGRLGGYMTKDSRTNRVSWSRQKSRGGAAVETGYRVLDSSRQASLLEIHLITGKSHQIRSHLAALGHPVLGDYKYGDRTFNNRLKKDYGLTHQLLHCGRVSLPGGTVISDPMPADMERIVKALGLTC